METRRFDAGRAARAGRQASPRFEDYNSHVMPTEMALMTH
jgi:hypothetical protein